jgi:hypothetical protein
VQKLRDFKRKKHELQQPNPGVETQRVQIIRPSLHHSFALRQMLCAIVGPAIGALHCMSQLLPNIIDTEPSTSSKIVRAVARKP